MSLDGKSLETYFRLGHELRERHNTSWTEYNQMIPWHLDVMVSLIHEELEMKKSKKQSQVAEM